MLVGREPELELLRHDIASVSNTGGRLVLVCGEAGIGKSSFIENIVEQAGADCITAVAWCDPLKTPRPLGPVRDLAAQLFADALQDQSEADCFEGIVALAQHTEKTLVLVIEDLHWVDQKTLDWLIFIGRRLSQLPVLLIGSYRDDEIEPTHPLLSALAAIPARRKTYVDLPPLSVDAVEEMGKHSDFSTQELHKITNGHPYFVAELLNSETGLADVPRSVSDVIVARFAALPSALRNFLETISCAPSGLPLHILERLGMDDLTALCDAAVSKRILVADGTRFKFRHELARLAVLARLGPGRNRDAHALLLSAHLKSPADAQALDMIVHHAEGAQDRTILLDYARRAAQNAASLGAHREAALFLGSALTCLDGKNTAVQAEVNEHWAYEAGLSLGIDDQVIDARERAVALWSKIDRSDRVGENLRWLSRLHWYRGEAEIAQTYILQAIEVLEGDGPSAEKGKAYALRAQFFMLQENMGEAVQWGERALAIAKEQADFDTQAHALNTIGSSKLFRGDLDGETHLRESLAIAHEHALHEQAARVYTNLSECLIELRALDRAEVLLEEGIAFDTAHDLDAWTFYLVGRKAQLRFEQSRYDEAILISQSVLDQPNQTVLMQLPARIILARSGIRTGHPDAADVLDDALQHAEQIGEPQYLLTLLITQLERAVLINDAELATSTFQRLGRFDQAVFSPTKWAEYNFWARLSGQQISNQGPELPKPFALFLSGSFDDAAAEFQGITAEYLAGWAWAALASDTALLKADEIFQSCNATAARAALRLRSDLPPIANRTRGPYRAAREHPYDLTAKEQTVLALMADGKSNVIIADELSRSRRTIENHVSAILSKLTCKNRLEAVLRTQSEPWILP